MTEKQNKKPGFGFGILVALGSAFGVALGAAYGAYSGNLSVTLVRVPERKYYS